MLRDRDGRPIPGVIFHVLFSDSRVELIQQFQAIQGPTGEVRLRVVRGAEFSEAAFALKVARFREYLGELPLVVEFCESIAPQANGKHKTIFASPPAEAPGPAPEASTGEGRGPAPWLS